jgi:3-vinyl bacteriochlorophyllide hydratase
MLTLNFFERFVGFVDGCPWATYAGQRRINDLATIHRSNAGHAPLYTPEQRRRRDETPWTMVQGILAPIQFCVFLASLFLVLRYLTTGEGQAVATLSVVVKTFTLYTIMITGAIWERVVFGRYLFARAFFWEDVFSMLVLTLHTLYLWAVYSGTVSVEAQMHIALAAYGSYVINAGQFVLKLRAARLEGGQSTGSFGAHGLSS